MMRKLLERLPGPASWASLIKLVIVQTDCYQPFVRQCMQNSSNLTESERRTGHDEDGAQRANANASARLGRVLGWHRAARVHRRLLVGVYLYLILKYQLLALIGSDSLPLSNMHYLDCFILGRFRFVGRTNKIAGEVISAILAWFLVFRLLNHTQGYKFYALEFLLASPEQAERNELLVGERRALIRWRKQGWGRCNERPVDSIFYLRCPFDQKVDESRWILRPNRTAESWLTLALKSKAILYSILLGSPLWFALVAWALAGSIQTNLGFEMSYPACVSWLRQTQLNRTIASGNYSYIYLAPRVLAHEIPIDSIPARIPFNAQHLFQRTSSFNLVRISCDIFENCLIYSEHFLVFTTTLYMFVIHATDVTLNALGIRTRMLKLLEELEAQRDELICGRRRRRAHEPYTRRAGKRPGHELRLGSEPPATRPPNSWQTEEIENLQAILADHFNTLTRGYNKSISLTFLMMGLGWLHYTVILCNWISTIRSRAVELEFLLAESIVTVMCVSLMLSFVLVRSQNLQLYPLITRAMALDPDWSASKLRWATTLKYFYPRPFFSFTIAGSLEISWLLCLKPTDHQLLAWILSAFCVLANFYYRYRY